MIRVCDALMGSGKSSSAINYMNAHPEKKYIYIAPYLGEAKRIKEGCPGLYFYEPNRANDETHHSKTLDTLARIREGRNIASTHEAFLYYTPEMIQEIRESHYTLLIDESVNVLDQAHAEPGDVEVLVAGGYVSVENETYVATDKEYPGTHDKEFVRKLKSRELCRVEGDQYKGEYYFWVLSSDFLLAFDDVIIMTYMFHGQDMYLLLKMNGVEMEYIGVRKDETGHHFSDEPCEPPEYTRNLRNMIHIFDNKKLNSIGENRCALSMSWFSSKENVEQLKRNMRQYFEYHMKGFGISERLYGTYKDRIQDLAYKGHRSCGLTFNARATNEYADKHVLVYAANVFYDGGRRKFFGERGIKINEDVYALSTMIQWIWRSAIRKGEEIWIYVPSRRMRELLQQWIDSLSNEGAGKPGAA